MSNTTSSDLAAAWTAAMSQDLPGAHDDDLLDIVSAVLVVTLGGA